MTRTAQKEPGAKEPAAKPPAGATPVARTDANSRTAHEQLLEKAKKGRIDVYFVGDSITRRWGATDYPDFLANWKQNFHGWNAANFGWGGDTVQNVLWRLHNGELDGVNPKVIVVMAGTNNVGAAAPAGGDDAKVDEIADGPQGGPRRVPGEGTGRRRHPDGHHPAERQPGRGGGHRQGQRAASHGSPTGRRSGT